MLVKYLISILVIILTGILFISPRFVNDKGWIAYLSRKTSDYIAKITERIKAICYRLISFIVSRIFVIAGVAVFVIAVSLIFKMTFI